MSKLPAWREYLSVCADVIQVTTFFGLSLAVLVAALVAVIGWLNEIPSFWIAVGTLVAAFAALGILNMKRGFAKHTRDAAHTASSAHTPIANSSDSAQNEFIGIRDGIILINDKLFDTRYGEQLRGFQKGQDSEDAKIALAGRLLSGDIQLYGMQPLSLTRRPIDTKKLEIMMAQWTDGGAILRRMNNKEILYSGLAFKTQDLTKFVDQVLADERKENEADAEFEKGFNRATFVRNKASRESAVLRLAQLRTAGVALRNEAEAGRVDEDNLRQWLGNVDQWMHEAIDAIWQVNQADSEWFRTLDIVPPARVPAPIGLKNQEHISSFVRNYNQHDLRLVRLDELLSKYRARGGCQEFCV